MSNLMTTVNKFAKLLVPNTSWRIQKTFYTEQSVILAYDK